jgi:hypothetical protein
MKPTFERLFAYAAAATLATNMATAQTVNKGCTNATLLGTFAYTVTGSITAPPALAGPFASVGTQTFDGVGGFTAVATVSQNGMIVPVTIKGTYTVNPDCSGTFSGVISPVGITSHIFFVIDDDEAGFQALQTDSGVVVSGVARRQFPVGDWRQ